jgi:hypothetical protein
MTGTRKRAAWLDRAHFDERDMLREEALNTASADRDTATRLSGWHPIFCNGFRLGWAAAMASVKRPARGDAAKRRRKQSRRP